MLKLARLLRIGPAESSPQIQQIMSGLTPPERAEAMKRASLINTFPGAAVTSPPGTTIRDTGLKVGWDFPDEDTFPGGGPNGWARGRIRIDIPGEEPRWRTIKVPFEPDMTWEEFWEMIEEIIAGWNAKYPGSIINFEPNNFIWF